MYRYAASSKLSFFKTFNARPSFVGYSSYSLVIHVSTEDPQKPLLVSHKPPMSKSGIAKDLSTDVNLRGDKLSVENLLVQTAQVCVR